MQHCCCCTSSVQLHTHPWRANTKQAITTMLESSCRAAAVSGSQGALLRRCCPVLHKRTRASQHTRGHQWQQAAGLLPGPPMHWGCALRNISSSWQHTRHASPPTAALLPAAASSSIGCRWTQASLKQKRQQHRRPQHTEHVRVPPTHLELRASNATPAARCQRARGRDRRAAALLPTAACCRAPSRPRC